MYILLFRDSLSIKCLISKWYQKLFSEYVWSIYTNKQFNLCKKYLKEIVKIPKVELLRGNINGTKMKNKSKKTIRWMNKYSIKNIEMYTNIIKICELRYRYANKQY